jgi:hypothetical protein
MTDQESGVDPKDVVRRGYDALSYRYRGDTEEPEPYATWLARLRERVPAGGAILDLGCGCGCRWRGTWPPAATRSPGST